MKKQFLVGTYTGRVSENDTGVYFRRRRIWFGGDNLPFKTQLFLCLKELELNDRKNIWLQQTATWWNGEFACLGDAGYAKISLFFRNLKLNFFYILCFLVIICQI